MKHAIPKCRDVALLHFAIRKLHRRFFRYQPERHVASGTNLSSTFAQKWLGDTPRKLQDYFVRGNIT